ncbi:MAG: phage/plasmid primase, P4 family [Macromonas sp.]
MNAAISNNQRVAVMPRGQQRQQPDYNNHPRRIDRLIDALYAIPAGIPREDWFHVLCAAKTEGIDRETADQWSQQAQDKYDAGAFRDTWKSIAPSKPNGKTGGYLVDFAKRHGWDAAWNRWDTGTPPRPSGASGAAAEFGINPGQPMHQEQEPRKEPTWPPAEVWSRCEPATSAHTYVAMKGGEDADLSDLRVVPADGIRIPGKPHLRIKYESMAGALVVPIRNAEGNLSSLQFINVGAVADRLEEAGNPKKLNLPGCPMDGWHVVGRIQPGRELYICEGLGTAWTAWKVTGCAAVVASGWGSVKKLARKLKELYPRSRLVMLPDSGQEGKADEIAKELGIAYVPMPDGLLENIDVNDWESEHGPDAVAGLLAETVDYAPAENPANDGDGIPPEFSEMAMASRFAELCGNQFRWTPGMDWMFNAGTHWERDDHLKRFNVVKAVCRDAANVAESINKASLASKLCSANTSSAVLSLARSESGIVTAVTEWNQGEMLLNTPGGVYNLETGREVSREGHLFTQVSGIAPDARMPIPIWERFIVEIFGGDLAMVEFVQRMAGYCLTGSTREQKLFFLYGAGANGKSVFIDALKDIAGKYGHNLPAEALMTSKHERHPTTLAALQGKRLAISSEIEESSHWAESRIKSLTGDATLTARFMRGDEFTFDITHKHILAGNFRPRLKGDDYAMQRRMVLVPFEQQFKGARCDINLPQKLKAEYPGILAWCIAGAAKWAESGLQIPTTVQESSREYMAEQNDIDLWIEECCNVGDGLRCKSSDLYTSYAAWKQRNGEVAGSSKVFSQRLERHFTKSKSHGVMAFARIELKPGEQQVAYLSR